MWSLFSRDPTKDFGYEVGDILFQEERSFWILHKGKKKGTSEVVSIFRYEVKPNEESYMDLAKNVIKRLKTLRHPSILTYVDSLVTEKSVLVVTESVEPLRNHLDSLAGLTQQQREFAISWGILSVGKGLCFLNNDCSLIHGNLSLGSVFVNNACDWKLFNLEYLTHLDDSLPYKTYYPHKVYTPPEISDTGRKPTQSADSWGLGCVIWEIFNGLLPDIGKLKSAGKISKKLLPLYGSLVVANPASRCSVQDFIAKGQQKGGYFQNIFIDSMVFLEEIQIKDSIEKNRFFSNLNNRIDSFPDAICTNKILPRLMTALEYGEASANILELLFKVGKMLNENEYQKRMMPCIIKLFSSKDRSVRSKLLKEMETYAELIPANSINEQIFPNLVQGFLDSNPIIREQTVKSIFHLAPKLNSQNLNDEVMKHFARIQFKDPEGGIRTNTIVCLGKIAGCLQPQTRQTIMMPAFVRSLRDPFPPSRIAGILSLCATQNFFTLQDCTTKIMPVLCTLLMDPEQQVRDHAFTALKNFITKMEKFSEDPSLIEQMESEINQSGSNVSSKFTSSLSWAVSSLAAKLSRVKVDEEIEKQSSITNKIGNLSANSTAKSIANNATSNSKNSIENNSQVHQTNKTRSEEQTNKSISVQQSVDNVHHSSSTVADGWDDNDDWTNEFGSQLDDFTQKSEVQANEQAAKQSANAWDEEELAGDWTSEWSQEEATKGATSKSVASTQPLDSFQLDQENKSTHSLNVRKTAANHKASSGLSNNTTAKVKRGPMRLGAQKISKIN